MTAEKDNSRLTRRHEQAIAALLLEPTIARAAQSAGISERTLRRWLERDNFRAAFMVARRGVVTQATAALQRQASAAVDTLRSIMTDHEAPAGNRVTAARTILELTYRAVELEDMEQRIAALEQLSKELKESG